ncbi:unnamed protein product [Vitrella brassicaformis CCMP3155]|uniref:Uncharacterized protein n=1 Tax=Vitrella brassicaformis (strain CCMP3155) TaxID=1169540 RepID=A0A0G4ETR8_VITBC|nr:unnamed protein product [Vitrella brassicaformis CCMP3155]|eukprot:CEM01716.1 unnamed protein product [Vitrella brassicaformis CCMP3155]
MTAVRPREAATEPSSSAAASDEEGRQAQREERERELRQQISDTPGLLTCITAFLPLCLLVQLSDNTSQHSLPKHRNLIISSSDSAERRIWQRVPLDLVTKWAARLTRLTAIVLRYPMGAVCWCFDVFIKTIEGHVAGRRAANMQGSTLRTITLEGAQLTRREMQSLQRRDPPLPSIVQPPPSLGALETVSGVTLAHSGLANRGWLMPSFERLAQQGWDASDVGQFVGSSRSLRHVDGEFEADEWAGVFEYMPVAAAGQPGPLGHLERIGTVVLRGSPDAARAAVDRLQAALWSRGCRQTLTRLTLWMEIRSIDGSILPLVESVESLRRACCRPDAQVAFSSSPFVQHFELSLFYSDDFPPNPSPLFKAIMHQLARRARCVVYAITQHDLTHPIDSPSDAAVDVASSLSFDRAEKVSVRGHIDPPPPPHTPLPHPTIIEHLQRFPRAGQLWICGWLCASVGHLLADKMANQVAEVVTRRLSVDALGVLGVLGGGREVRKVMIWLSEGALDELGTEEMVAAVNRTNLPRIDKLCFYVYQVSAEGAGNRIRAAFTPALLSALFDHVPGPQSVSLSAGASDPARASIRAVFPDGSTIGHFPVTVESWADDWPVGGLITLTASRGSQ